MKRAWLLVLLVALGISAFAQFSFTITEPAAVSNFRIGVEAYHRGRFAEALMLFESVLTKNPGNQLVLFWLGKAYHKLGLDSSTLEFWTRAAAGTESGLFPQARAELLTLVMNRNFRPIAERYIESRTINGRVGNQNLFVRPSSLLSVPDGSFLVVANGSNELLKINSNGLIVGRMTGGVSGFDRPYGLALLPGGGYVVSEFMADRLAFLDSAGGILSYAPYQNNQQRMVGPQYLAQDRDGFLYVSDVGRSRIVKLQPDGTFVAAFSARSGDFQGLIMPTGLAVMADRLYIADAALKSLLVTDLYGNLVDVLSPSGLARPEGLTVVGNRLLIADLNRVFSYDPFSGNLALVYQDLESGTRFTSVAVDANGDMILADYNNSRLILLTDPLSTYAGLWVEVEKIHTGSYPLVALDVKVTDHSGRPITGLDSANFYVSEFVTRVELQGSEGGNIPVQSIVETIKPAAQMAYEGSLDSTPGLNVQWLIPADPALVVQRSKLSSLFNSVLAPKYAGVESHVLAFSSQPGTAVPGTEQAFRALLASVGSDKPWRLDLALRAAVNSLTSVSARRSIMLFSTGSLPDLAIEDYTLADLAALLENNRVVFNVIHLGPSPVAAGLQYLCEQSGGLVFDATRNPDLASLIEHTLSRPTGLYRLAFRASTDTDFGRRYLNIRVEAYFRDRSGKDETGYFAPLQ